MSRKRTTRHLLAVLIALVALSIGGVVAAHPLGNFTVSRYSALTLREAAIDVLYVVDMAEIPTFRERQAMDADGDGAVSAAEESSWLAATVPDLAANLHLTVDGASIILAPQGSALTFPPGQGELPTLRLELRLTAALPPVAAGQARAVEYEDGNYAGRLGWQEVVASASDGSLLDSSVPAAGLSDALRDYPADLLQSPPAVNRATVRHAPLAGAAPVAPAGGDETTAVAANRFSSDEFANLLGRTLDSPGALAAALLVAVGLGAAHALTPGHGKTIVGAYLVGSRGKARHALLLGLVTTITHTAGVFALGFFVLLASEFILPERLYPWLGVLSGLLVVVIGLSILRGHLGHWLARRRGEAGHDGHFHYHFGGGGHSHHDHGPRTHDHGVSNQTATPRLLARRPIGSDGARTLAFAGVADGLGVLSGAREHAHPHQEREHHHDHADAHDHDQLHAHAHGHDHAHHHAPTAAGQDALSMRNLLALGISGGLLPCPSALILMLSAIALHQVGLGIVLIIAFSVGLAGVLTAIGLIMVYAGKLLERLPIRHTAMTARILPMASATFITLAGLLITLRALAEAGVL